MEKIVDDFILSTKVVSSFAVEPGLKTRKKLFVKQTYYYEKLFGKKIDQFSL